MYNIKKERVLLGHGAYFQIIQSEHIYVFITRILPKRLKQKHLQPLDHPSYVYLKSQALTDPV